jgi:hypothetical protein
MNKDSYEINKRSNLSPKAKPFFPDQGFKSLSDSFESESQEPILKMDPGTYHWLKTILNSS